MPGGGRRVVLAWLLGFQLVVWTLVPALISANLQLDLVEGLALGKEWQLGYWKHPPLPWWVTDLAYRLTGHDRRGLYPRPARGRGLSLCGLAAGARGRRRHQSADRGRGAGGDPLLQHLGREIRARPDAIAVLGADRLVLLARDRARAHHRLDARRPVPRRRVLVEIRRLRVGGDARPDPAARSVRAPRLAHARALRDGRRVRDRDRAERLVARQQRLHAVPLCRRSRRRRRALVSLSPVPAALDRRPVGVSAAGAGPAGAALSAAPPDHARNRQRRRRLQPPLRRGARARPVRGDDRSSRPCSDASRSRCGAIRCGRSCRSPC